MTECSTPEKALLREAVWRRRHPDADARNEHWPATCEPNEEKLGDFGITREYEWETETAWLSAYEVELHKYIAFDYVLDLGGSTNTEMESVFEVKDMVVTATLQPFERETICVLSCTKAEGGTFSFHVSGSQSEIPASISTMALEINRTRIRSEFDSMKAALVGISPTDDTHALVAALSRSQVQFVDEDFYPSPTALYKDADGSELVAEEQIMWRRAADFCKKPAVFSDGIEPSDVVQGSRGDCWFCCSLAAMAERPPLIERLFVTKEFSEVGLYRVRFCHLDDFIPCRLFQGPIYTKTGGDELWAALLEKAYAKIYGCYQRLEGGSPFDALPDLSGCPATNCDLLKFDDIQRRELWHKLLDWKSTEHNLVSASCGKDSLVDVSEAGLFPDHGYTLLDAKQWDKGPATVRLVCLRNPWGNGEWNKDWSDEDQSHWTKEAVDFFGATLNPTDGTFWMSYEDFPKYFTKLTVAYCRPDFVDARIPLHLTFDFGTSLLTVPLVRLKIPDGGNCEFLGLYQADTRKKGTPEYLDLAMFVFKEDASGGRQPVAYTKMNSERQQFLMFGSESDLFKKPLAAGNYLLMPFTSVVHWDPASGSTRTIAMSAHVYGTSVKPTMEVVTTYTRDEIDKALLECTMHLGDESELGQLQRRDLDAGHLSIFAGRNVSEDLEINYRLKCTPVNIVDAIGYPKLNEGCSFDIRPHDCVLFGVQVLEDSKQSASMKYAIGYRHKAYVPLVSGDVVVTDSDCDEKEVATDEPSVLPSADSLPISSMATIAEIEDENGVTSVIAAVDCDETEDASVLVTDDMEPVFVTHSEGSEEDSGEDSISDESEEGLEFDNFDFISSFCSLLRGLE